MTVVTVAQFKAFDRVIHNSDDALILDLIAGAEAEALQFMDRQDLPRFGEDEAPDEADTSVVIDVISEGTSLAPDVRRAIYYLVQAGYSAKDIDESVKLRKAAETILFPHRRQMGA